GLAAAAQRRTPVLERRPRAARPAAWPGRRPEGARERHERAARARRRSRVSERVRADAPADRRCRGTQAFRVRSAAQGRRRRQQGGVVERRQRAHGIPPARRAVLPLSRPVATVIRRTALVAVLVLGLATAAVAQFGFGFGPRAAPPRLPNDESFGRGFTF